MVAQRSVNMSNMAPNLEPELEQSQMKKSKIYNGFLNYSD